MTARSGQTLDKYQLLEEVGQGGMAVVFRGLDTSLEREVAVKVLHRHLAEDRESRERFEREARAVAKLRHANILEIFDFSGLSSAESYIVTEFIEGQTLKQFISHYDLRYPEVGAMIVAQVLRALTHAHSAGILHRDIKPENIMVRSDGVVKLTDFGIAQMVDLQRMTVTGQLLGSPAYMSPEHVSGGQLDFRTDVFSVGILLYQLVTGELPFTGKNPHEILKRIADCNHRPVMQVNPLVGERLARIIEKAMACDKDDRFADVAEMLRELEAFLEASGLDDADAELRRFFGSPAAYDMALEQRLLDAWTRRGEQYWDERRQLALDYYNRVLTLDPDNADVLARLDSASRRRRSLRLVLLFAGVATLVGGAALGKTFMGEQAPPAAVGIIDADADADVDLAATTVPADAGGVTLADAGTASGPDSGAPHDAGEPAADAGTPAVRRPTPVRPPVRPRAIDAGPSGEPRQLQLQVYPRNSEVQVGDGAWQAIPGQSIAVEIPAGDVEVTIRNPRCCQSESLSLAADDEGGSRTVTLPYLPAVVVPECDEPVRVNIDGRPGRIGRPRTILMSDSPLGAKTVEVEFIRESPPASKAVKVPLRYRQREVVKCGF